MDTNMLRRALWVFLRPLLQLITNLLSPEVGEEWLEELKKFLRKEPTWVTKVTKRVEEVVNLIQAVGEVAFPGATNFVVSEKLGVDKSETATVKISGHGSNFSSWFLGKIETNVAPSRLGYGKLLRRAKAAVIRAFLGGEATAKTSLAEIHYLITLQPNGEEGALLTNGWANIFFVRDKDHVLRLVYVFWRDGGWCWGADGLSSEVEWDDDQVFSRKVA
ncbi:MAG: hypothetical protein ABL899_00920 [Nitrospira sp.]